MYIYVADTSRYGLAATASALTTTTAIRNRSAATCG